MEADLSFGAWLQRRRKGLDLTQAELAQQIGYARVTIHKIETDQLRASRQIADKLADALAIDPSEREAFARFARDDLRAGPLPALPPVPALPPLPGSARRRHNLPVSLTPFIGREREVREGCALLCGNVRLLTLTGTGGIGKTRLALEIAAATVETFPDGVWFVDLAPLADPDLVSAAVAAALGLRGSPGQPVRAALVAALRGRRLLVVLDNCEHLVEACARFVEEIVRAAPDVRILATSREALGIAGEVNRRVPSLSLPPRDALPSPDRLTQSEAVRLFVECARAVQPEFAVNDRNAGAVAQVCASLDGIALALELAAARLRGLSVQQLSERLDQQFRLLTGGRTAPRRQQTIRAAIDWSYDLLTPEERSLFNRLSVFAGGWTLEAAETVCSGEGIATDLVLELLLRLVDKSLVATEERPDGLVRYRLLELLRQYARERLAARGEASVLGARHAAYYRALATQAGLASRGPQELAWQHLLQQEHDNVRAALRTTLASGAADAGLHSAAPLWWFWYVRGHVTEGREWLARLLALPGGRTASRAQALFAAGQLAILQGDHAGGRPRVEESVALWRELGDEVGLAAALHALAHLAPDESVERSLLGESVALFRGAQDSWNLAWSLHCLGNAVAAAGDTVTARTLHEESVARFRATGSQSGLAMGLAGMGHVAVLRGEYELATRLYEHTLAIRQEMGDLAVSDTLNALGNAARGSGDYRRAVTCFREGLVRSRDTDINWELFLSLAGLGHVAAATRQLVRSVRLFAAAETLRLALGVRLVPADQADWDRAIDAARADLGDNEFAAAWIEGHVMSLEQAMAYALADDAEPASTL